MLTGEGNDALDIPQLHWEDFLTDEHVATAYADLKRLTNRTVALHSTSLVPLSDIAFIAPGAKRFTFSLTSRHHTAVLESFVHELLHGILVEEGYCKVAARVPNDVQQILSNDLQHPEILRRTEAYGLDMALEWRHWDSEFAAALVEMRFQFYPYAGMKQFPGSSLGSSSDLSRNPILALPHSDAQGLPRGRGRVQRDERHRLRKLTTTASGSRYLQGPLVSVLRSARADE